jgi:hypothetical protein
MRRRLYFTLPDVQHCKQLVAELQAAVGLNENYIHVIARDNIVIDDLPKANLLQKTELVHGLELGLGVGGVAGMLGGLLTVTFPPAGLALAGGAVILMTTLAGAGFGGLVSALVASDIPNHELEAFQGKIALGEILLILDIPTIQVKEIIDLIRMTHPEAKIGIIKPTTSQTVTTT